MKTEKRLYASASVKVVIFQGFEKWNILLDPVQRSIKIYH